MKKDRKKSIKTNREDAIKSIEETLAKARTNDNIDFACCFYHPGKLIHFVSSPRFPMELLASSVEGPEDFRDSNEEDRVVRVSEWCKTIIDEITRAISDEITRENGPGRLIRRLSLLTKSDDFETSAYDLLGIHKEITGRKIPTWKEEIICRPEYDIVAKVAFLRLYDNISDILKKGLADL